MSLAQQPAGGVPVDVPAPHAVAADVMALQRMALDYEKAALRKWLHRLGVLLLTVAGGGGGAGACRPSRCWWAA